MFVPRGINLAIHQNVATIASYRIGRNNLLLKDLYPLILRHSPCRYRNKQDILGECHQLIQRLG
ncbi:hypothetical protein D3C75_1197090 [compost metagenome]